MEEDPSWEKLVRSNLTNLTKFTVIGTKLVTSLLAKGLIDDEETDMLLNQSTPNIKRAMVLYSSIANKWSDSDFEDLKAILSETGNSRAHQIFTMKRDVSSNLVVKASKEKINFQKDNLKLISKIGNGDFGNVWLVKDQRTEEQFAVKQMHLPKIANDYPQISLRKIKKEAKTLRGLQHGNIVPYIDDWFVGPNSKLYEENTEAKIILGEETSSSAPITALPLDFFFIQMKYFPTCLKNFLLSHGSQHARSTIRLKLYDIFQQSLAGLEHVHSKGTIHRDIKPANILINETPVLHVALGDFGLAIDEDSTMSITGTPIYRAPELDDNKPHTESADVFSLGLTFRECLEYFPDASSRGSVFAAYKDRSGNLEDILQRTFNSQTLNELEWQCVHQMTKISSGSRINATGAVEWVRQFLICDHLSDLIWNEYTKGMVCVPNPIWINVPLPAETFVGRQAQIEMLMNIWKSQSCKNIHISGFSGVGVSELLYTFLKGIRGFSYCIFLNVSTIENFQKSLLSIFSSLGLKLEFPSSTQEILSKTVEQLNILTEKLSSRPRLPSLIVVLHKYSNSQADIFDVVNYFVNHISARMVIVTSNNNHSLGILNPTKLEVPSLTQEESVQLLRSLVKNLPTSDKHLQKLVSFLGCVPHVLNSTAEYLQSIPASELPQTIHQLYTKLKGSDETVYQLIANKSFHLADNWADNLNQALQQWNAQSALKSNPQVAKQFAESFVLVLAFINPSTYHYRHFYTYLKHAVDLDSKTIDRNVSNLFRCLANHHICTYTENTLCINAAIQRCIRLRLKNSLPNYMKIVVNVLGENFNVKETFVDAALFWKRFVLPNKNLTKSHMELSVSLAGDLFVAKCYSQMKKHLKCIVNYFIKFPPESETEDINSTRSKVLYAIALIVCNKEDWEVTSAIAGLTLNSVEEAFYGFVHSDTLSCYISTIENKIRAANTNEPISSTEDLIEELNP